MCLHNMVLWLEKIQPRSDDLVQIWRDQEFLTICDDSFFTVARGDFYQQPLTASQSKDFDEIVLRSPQLLRILEAWWICSNTCFGCTLSLSYIKLLFNISWNDITTAVCLLRPFITDHAKQGELFQFLVRSSVACREKYPWPTTSRNLVKGCIHILKSIKSGGLSPDLWPRDMDWEYLLSLCASSPTLLQDLSAFRPRPTWNVHASSGGQNLTHQSMESSGGGADRLSGHDKREAKLKATRKDEPRASDATRLNHLPEFIWDPDDEVWTERGGDRVFR
ncbi:hypothetical protein B0H13DRAFT_253652 [Mycena leptocephala]|nr:hypothetical protein B0H13DRAFT_253652 [Mycena leptocephala]